MDSFSSLGNVMGGASFTNNVAINLAGFMGLQVNNPGTELYGQCSADAGQRHQRDQQGPHRVDVPPERQCYQCWRTARLRARHDVQPERRHAGRPCAAGHRRRDVQPHRRELPARLALHGLGGQSLPPGERRRARAGPRRRLATNTTGARGRSRHRPRPRHRGLAKRTTPRAAAELVVLAGVALAWTLAGDPAGGTEPVLADPRRSHSPWACRRPSYRTSTCRPCR